MAQVLAYDSACTKQMHRWASLPRGRAHRCADPEARNDVHSRSAATGRDDRAGAHYAENRLAVRPDGAPSSSSVRVRHARRSSSTCDRRRTLMRAGWVSWCCYRRGRASTDSVTRLVGPVRRGTRSTGARHGLTILRNRGLSRQGLQDEWAARIAAHSRFRADEGVGTLRSERVMRTSPAPCAPSGIAGRRGMALKLNGAASERPHSSCSPLSTQATISKR